VGYRLNLGCGDEHLDGWIHVDYRPDVADAVADATALPFGAGTADEIRALDLIEHFPHSRTQAILAEWHRVLVPSGTLTLKLPNMLELARWIVADRRTELVIRNIYGGFRWGPGGTWDMHNAGWTPDLFTQELVLAGFEVLSNDLELNMTVTARKR
jgi:hypothetical protein